MFKTSLNTQILREPTPGDTGVTQGLEVGILVREGQSTRFVVFRDYGTGIDWRRMVEIPTKDLSPLKPV